MDFSSVVETLNKLLARIQPDVFNSSWIRKHAPQCYRFIRQNLRREFGGIDWDRLTYALDWKFQKRWTPVRTTKTRLQYEDHAEVTIDRTPGTVRHRARHLAQSANLHHC